MIFIMIFPKKIVKVWYISFINPLQIFQSIFQFVLHQANTFTLIKITNVTPKMII